MAEATIVPLGTAVIQVETLPERGPVGDITPEALAAQQAAEVARELTEDARDVTLTAKADTLTAQGLAETARNKAQDWAESPTEPGGVGTKSSKTWTGLAEGHANDAATAQLGAELARDTALVNANIYVSPAAGIAATTNGQQFGVVEGEYIQRYSNNAGVADIIPGAKYPTAAAVQKAPSRSLGTIEDAATAGAGSIRYVTDGDTGFTPCFAGSNGAQWGKISLGSVITPWRADTRALIARMTTPPSSAIGFIYDTFFQDLSDAAILGLLEAFHLYAAHDAQAAPLNWISASHDATLPVAPPWTAFRGYAPDGVSKYLNSNVNPSSLSLSGLDDASMMLWANIAKQRPVAGALLGGNQSILLTIADTQFYAGLNHSTAGADAFTGLENVIHYMAASRTGAAASTAYSRASKSSVFTRASTARLNQSIFIGAEANGAIPVNFGASEIAAFAYGRGMSDAQHVSFRAILTKMMRSLGNYQEPIAGWGDSRTAGSAGQTIWHSQIQTASGNRRIAHNGGVSGQRSAEIRARMLADTLHADHLQIIWAGYNGGGTAGSPIQRYDAGYFAAVMADIAAMVADAQAKSGRYLVLTLPRSNMATQYVGTTEGDALGAVNAAILSTYGSKAVDVATLLQTSGTTDPNGCIHADYVINMGTDPIHLITIGNTVVADAIIAAIAANGWL